MPPTLVQKKGAQTGASSASLDVTLDAPPTAGNLLVAAANSDATVATPTGFTLAVSAVNQQGLYIWYRVVQGGDSATVTFVPSVSDSVAAGVLEYSGLTASPLDKTASNTTASGGTSAIATGTTAAVSQNAELVIACAGPHSALNGTGPWTLSSWTAGYASQIAEAAGLGAERAGCFVADQTISSGGTQTATATFTSSFDNAGAAIATFLAATSQDIAATGLVSTTGSAALNVNKTLGAVGLASTSGAMALTVNVTLAAQGLVSMTGTAALLVSSALAAQALVSTAGTFALAMLRTLAGAALASTAGSFYLGAPTALAAQGLVSTSGSFAFASAGPVSTWPTKAAASSSWPTKAGS
ncbi:MAG: hypothetical protein ABR532_08985 [Candidatus Dormibacteria bacterium]